MVDKLDETKPKPKWLNTRFIGKVIERYEEQIDFDDENYPLDSEDSYALYRLYAELGKLYAEQENHQKAVDKYKKSIKYREGKEGNGPSDPDLHKCLATSYQALEQYKEAVVEFDKAATAQHEFSEIARGRSESLLKLIEKQEKDFQEKLETFLEGPDSNL